MSIKRIVIYISIIVSVLSVVSCKEEFPTLENFAEYSKYLENGDLEGVKKYYKKFGPRSVEQYGVEGLYMINPLEAALYYNHYDIAEFLLKKGANPDAISPTMHTPIIFNCIVNNNIKGLELLIKYNADVSVFNDSDGCSTLWYAAATGVEILDIIYKRTKDINVKNKDKATALFGAVIMGRFDCAKFLIDHGIDVNAINSIGCSALMYAVNIGRIDICEYLIEHGADISIVDNEGYDAKWIADELGLQIKGLTY
jgi:ankyrin repeat protein